MPVLHTFDGGLFAPLNNLVLRRVGAGGGICDACEEATFVTREVDACGLRPGKRTSAITEPARERAFFGAGGSSFDLPAFFRSARPVWRSFFWTGPVSSAEDRGRAMPGTPGAGLLEGGCSCDEGRGRMGRLIWANEFSG